MNKTIKDAYEELKGDLGNLSETLCEDDLHIIFCDGDYFAHEDPDFDDVTEQYICTVEEFNNYKGDDVKFSPTDHIEVTAMPVSFTSAVYTQAMCDAGESPSVGMEVAFDTTFFTTQTSNKGMCEIIAYFGGKVWINIVDFDCVINLNVIEFKPLTPPIQLDHGKAYQFDYRGMETCGIYSERHNLLYSDDSIIEIDDCTNIQLLTVEGE